MFVDVCHPLPCKQLFVCERFLKPVFLLIQSRGNKHVETFKVAEIDDALIDKKSSLSDYDIDFGDGGVLGTGTYVSSFSVQQIETSLWKI